jgi:biofilm PGA synthesis N-glycosyltransferase PgaC
MHAGSIHSKRFVIITPAFNEQRWIGQTIEKVLQMTCLPDLWLIVDDDSTDQTASVIQNYASHHPWIRYYHRQKVHGQSYYSSNVYAILEGYEQIRMESFDYLAILDGDISLPQTYYESLLAKFEADPELGIASGVYLDCVNGKLRKILNDRRSTPKALMVFRRTCYEAIGGLVPMKYGGEDTCACFTARMKGWKTWSFPDLAAIHNKPVGTGHGKSMLQIRFRQGIGEYFMAMHPLFMILKSLRRCFLERPFLLGGLARMAGYCCGWLKREPLQIPQETVRFIRAEQRSRIFGLNRMADSTGLNPSE